MIKIESTATNSYPGLQIVNDAQAWEVSTHGGHSDALTFYNGTTHTFALATNGNVGIGTTSPSSEFHVKGDAATVARVEPNNNSGKSTLLLSSAGAGDGGMQYDSNSNLMHLFSYNYMTFNVGTGNLSGGYPSNERMRITNTGNVGINETSPDFSGFGSNGGGLELDDVGANFTAIRLSHGATGDFYMAANTGAAYLWGKANSPIVMATNNTEAIRIAEAGTVGIGTTSAVGGANGTPGLQMVRASGSFSGAALQIQAEREATANYGLADFYSGTSADRQFNLKGDGNAYADGSWSGGGADYAEYFEWADGNSSNQDRVGYSVSLVNNKIKIAESGETVIGVISGNPAVVGDNSWNSWKDKYQKDDYGRYILDSDGYRTPNSDYDDSLTYIPREERKEWDVVGLMGKLRIKKGQQTNSSWIKMRDISDSVEEWLVK